MEDRIKNAFENIKADEELKEKTKALVFSRANKQKNRSLRIALASCVILMLFSFSGYGLYFDMAYAVSFDSGQLIELQVNRFDRVIGVKYENDDVVMPVNQLKHMKCEDAVSALSETESFMNFINEGGNPSISVKGSDSEKCKRKAEKLQHCVRKSNTDNIEKGHHCVDNDERHHGHKD